MDFLADFWCSAKIVVTIRLSAPVYIPGFFLCALNRINYFSRCLSQVKELNHVLEAEKSCRTDLEMYVAVLNTQKSVLQEDAEKLRKELHDGNFLWKLLDELKKLDAL